MHKTKKLKALAASSGPIFVLASTQPAIKRGEMASYKCQCHARFMAYASQAPFCVVCGSEEVEQVGEDSDDFNFPKDDENVASVQCPHCYTNNIMLSSVASVLAGKMHCVTCGEGVEYIAPDMPDDYVYSDPSTFLNNESDNSLLDTADLDDDEDVDFSKSFGDDDDEGTELGELDQDENSDDDVPEDDSDLQMAAIKVIARLDEEEETSDNLENSEEADLDGDGDTEESDDDDDVPEDDSDLQMAAIRVIAGLDSGMPEDISDEDMDSLEPETSEDAMFGNDEEFSDDNLENSEEAEFENSDDNLENSEEAEFDDDGNEITENLEDDEGEGANTDIGSEFSDETSEGELASDEGSDIEGGEEYTGEGDDLDDAGDFEKPEAAKFKMVATVSGNLSFQSTTDSLIALVRNVPVATLTKEKAGENAGLLHSESFAEAIRHTASQLGKEKALAHYGFDLISVRLPVSSFVKKQVARKVKAAVTKVDSKTKGYSKKLNHALQIASAGMNKSFFKGSSNVLKESLYRELEAAGLRNPAKVIDKVFAARADEYHQALFEKAYELMNMTPEVRNQLAAAIGDSNYQGVENSDEESEDDRDLNNTLETSGVRPTKKQETASTTGVVSSIRKFGPLF